MVVVAIVLRRDDDGIFVKYHEHVVLEVCILCQLLVHGVRYTVASNGFIEFHILI